MEATTEIDLEKRHQEHCMVCHQLLQYYSRARSANCHYCDQPGEWYISCPAGHVVCDTCHNQQTMLQIEEIIFCATTSAPLKIALQCMDFQNLPMLGCHHAFIACGALMAALKNSGAVKLTDDDIHEVFRRTSKQAHGGYCGLTGLCGIVPALGACVAVLNGSKCGLDLEQRLTMELVVEVARAITEITGPSCCKAYVRTSLKVATDFFKQNFSIFLPINDDEVCQHMEKHPHGCRTTKCPYYPEGGLQSDVTLQTVNNDKSRSADPA